MLLGGHFRPEFLNRIDDIILFHRLDQKQIRQIVGLHVAQLQRQLGERHLELKVDEPALSRLSEIGFDVAYGARPLKRVLQQQILDPLAMMIIDNKVSDGDTILATLDDKKQIILSVKSK